MSAIAELDAVVARLIAEQRAGLGDDGTVLAMLLRARDEDGRPMPDRQVRDEVLTLMLAGHETTANALAWTWLLLDRNPAAAGRLHAELDAAPAGARLAELPYTHAVIAESMRLYPPAWVIGRRMTADVTLAGWSIPAGSLVLASQWVTQRDPRWWPDARAFSPERWLTADGRYDEARAGPAARGVLPVRHGPAGLHRRVVRLDRGGARARRAGPRLGAVAGPRPPGRAPPGGHPAPDVRPAHGPAPPLSKGISPRAEPEGSPCGRFGGRRTVVR